jgi:hypothetical protein
VSRADRDLDPLHTVADEISLLCEFGGDGGPRAHGAIADRASVSNVEPATVHVSRR